jgi:hypothetical protein
MLVHFYFSTVGATNGASSPGCESRLVPVLCALLDRFICDSVESRLANSSKASLYHLDKYEHLAPEMKKIASARMADINTDFSRIKEDMNTEEAVASL